MGGKFCYHVVSMNKYVLLSVIVQSQCNVYVKYNVPPMCLTGACATKSIIKQNFMHPYSNSMHARHVTGNNNDGYFIGYF